MLLVLIFFSIKANNDKLVNIFMKPFVMLLVREGGIFFPFYELIPDIFTIFSFFLRTIIPITKLKHPERGIKL